MYGDADFFHWSSKNSQDYRPLASLLCLQASNTDPRLHNLHYCVWHNSGPDVLPRLFSPEEYELFEIFKFIDAF